jgi:hypothetical protein
MAAVIIGVTVPRTGVAGVPGRALPPLRVVVTGDPTPIATQRLAILTTARAAVPEMRSIQIGLAQTAPPLQLLSATAGASVRAIVQVTPAAVPPRTWAVRVEITHTAVARSDAEVLLVSNSPETLGFSKVLFSTTLETRRGARLLYHHQNGSTVQRMTVTVALSNPTARPVTLWITAAGPGDGSDELVLGHGAAHEFLTQYWSGAGFVLAVPAHTTLPLLVHRLPPQGIASGLVQLTLVGGGRLALQVIARMEDDPDPPPDSYLPDADQVHQRGTFDPPDIVRPLDYTVGGPPLMTALGAEEDLVREHTTDEALQGNYGVIYTFPVRIENPAAAPAILALVMHAVGGQAGATFRIGDQVVEVPRVPAGGIQPVATIRVAPGEHRTVVISTMPESGANYPVLLTLEPQ